MGAKPLVVVDDAVAGAQALFGEFGELRRIPGAEIGASDLKDANALVVRSVTRIDAELLAEAEKISFVGSATAGVDHVDRGLLARRGVEFAHAAGCNAMAVTDWVTAALFDAIHRSPQQWRGPIGIVGVGQVGSRLTRRLRALGLEVLGCDPPRRILGFQGHDLETLVAHCKVLSFHVPLNRGPCSDATVDMLAGKKVRGLSLINTSRGPVISNTVLRELKEGAAIVDVWEGEPNLDWELLAARGPVLRASPHVAGYTQEAKIRGTAQIRAALLRHFGLSSVVDAVANPDSPQERLDLELRCGESRFDSPLAALVACLHSVVNIQGDEERLNDLVRYEESTRARGFEGLRRNYSLRREFSAYQIRGAALEAIGSQLSVPLAIEGEEHRGSARVQSHDGCNLRDALESLGFSLGKGDG